MMRLNLLPHRDWALQRQQLRFKWSLVCALALGTAVSLVYGGWLQMQISSTQANNQVLQAEISRFEHQIQDLARVELDIATLTTQLHTVEDLQGSRNLPVRMLSEVARRMPQEVYLLSLRQDHENLTLQGVANSSERVSELMRALGSSPGFTKVELVEIVAANRVAAPLAQRRVVHFTLHVKLVLPPAGSALTVAAPGGTPAAAKPFIGDASP